MEFPKDVLMDLDAHILANRKMDAIELIRAATGVPLGVAIRELSARYACLRHERPEDFAEEHDVYWNGFFS